MSDQTTADNLAEWRAWRRTGITATTAAKGINLSPYGGPWVAWAELTGLVDDDIEPNNAMRFGTRMEPVLGDWFTEDTGLYVVGEQMWCSNPAEPWMLATVDGFAVESPHSGIDDAHGGVEKKTTTDPVDAWRKEIPIHVAIQCQWQMAVTGMPRTYLPTLHHGWGVEFVVHVVERDEDDIAALIKANRTLWFDHVLTQTPPPVDSSDATTRALNRAWDAIDGETVEADDDLATTVEWIRDLKAELKDREAALATLENEVRAALGEATHLTHGVDAKGKPRVLATWRPSSRTGFDTKALLARPAGDATERSWWDLYLARFKTVTETRSLLVKNPKGTS